MQTILAPPPTIIRNMPNKKMQHKIIKPQPYNLQQHHQNQQQPRNSQSQGQNPPNNIDYDKLRAVADLESEIGEVIDGRCQ